MSEDECYLRCYGSRSDAVAAVVITPARPKPAVMRDALSPDSDHVEAFPVIAATFH